MSVDTADRFHLEIYTESFDVWEVLLSTLTPYEAACLRTAMEEQEKLGDNENDDLEDDNAATTSTRNAMERSRRGGAGGGTVVKKESSVVSLLTSQLVEDNEGQLTPTDSGGFSHASAAIRRAAKAGCSPSQFCRAYLQTIHSIAFQRHMQDLLHRLKGLFHHYDDMKAGRLKFHEFPPLKELLEGRDPSSHKPRMTTYSEQGTTINSVKMTKEVLEQLPDLPNEFRSLSIPACKYLKYHVGMGKFSASCGHTFFLFDIDTDNECIEVTHVLFGEHKSVVTGSLHVPQIRRLITCGPDRQLVSWDDHTLLPHGGKARVSSPVTSIDYEPYSQNLVAGCSDGTMYLLPTQPTLQTPIKQVQAHNGWVTDICCISELQQIATSGADGIIKMWTHGLELRSSKLQDRLAESETTPSATTPSRTSGSRAGRIINSPDNKSKSTSGAVASPGVTGPPQLGIALDQLCYSGTQRTLYSSVSGRSLCLWSPFMDRPIEVLTAHDKPLIHIHCFKNSPEVLTVDSGGRVAVWDITRNLTVQKYGGADSVTPAGTIHSAVYCPVTGSVITMGSWMTVFSPEQGTFAPLFEMPISHMVYAPVNKVIITATGNKVIVVDVVSGASKNVFSIGVEEVSCLMLTSREQLIIGTSNANIYFTSLHHWKLQKVITLDDTPFLIHDLGEGSRLGTRGEDNGRLITVSHGGRVGHCAYGPMSGLTPAPPVVHKTSFQSVSDAAFFKDSYSIFMAEDNVLGCWDVEHGNRRGGYTFKGLVISMKCIPELDALLLSLTDGTIWLFHTTSTLPVASIRLDHDIGPVPSRSLKAAPDSRSQFKHISSAVLDGKDADISGPILSSITYNSSASSIMISTPSRIQSLDMERLLQRVHRETAIGDSAFHSIKSLQVVSTGARRAWDEATVEHRELTRKAKNVKKLVSLLKERVDAQNTYKKDHTLLIDTVTYRNDIQPYCLRCRFKGKEKVMMIAEADGQGSIRCIKRILQLRAWWGNRDFIHQQGGGDDVGEEGMEVSVTVRNSLAPSTVASYICLPEMIHIPTTPADAILPGLEGRAVYTIYPPIRADIADVLELEKHSSVHHSEFSPDHHASVHWMALCVAMALNVIHADQKVALFSQNSIRFVSPNYQLVLQHGLWDCVTAEEVADEEANPTTNAVRSQKATASNSAAKFESLLKESDVDTAASENVTALFQKAQAPPRSFSTVPNVFEQHNPSENRRKSRTTFLLNDAWGDDDLDAHDSAILERFRAQEASFDDELDRPRTTLTTASSTVQQQGELHHFPPTPSQSLGDALRHIPSADLPPGGLQSIMPPVDMWLLGLSLFRACAGKPFESRGLAGRRGGYLPTTSSTSKEELMSLVSTQIQSTIHPLFVQDPFITKALEGLLNPDPEARITAPQLLELAAAHHLGKKLLVKTQQEVDLACRGISILTRPESPKRPNRKSRKDPQAKVVPPKTVQLISHLPSVVLRRSQLKRKSITTNLSSSASFVMMESVASRSSIYAVPEEEYVVLQFTPPTHIRLPCVEHPFVRNDHDVVNISSTELVVQKVPFNPSDHAAGIGGGGGGSTNHQAPIMATKSFFCRPANPSLGGSPVSFIPLVKGCRFTCFLPIPALHVVFVAEFNKEDSYSYVSIRRNLCPETFTKTLLEYVAENARTSTKPGARRSSIRTVDDGPGPRSAYTTQALGVIPPNASIHALGGVELVLTDADQVSGESANTKDIAELDGSMMGVSQFRPKQVEEEEITDSVFGALHKRKKPAYDPTVYCPFFTDSKTMAEQEGLETTGPEARPFYLDGWHRTAKRDKEEQRRKANVTASIGGQPSSSSTHHQRLPPLLGVASTTSTRSFVSKLRENNRQVDNGNTKRKEPGSRRTLLSQRTGDEDILCLSRLRKPSRK